MDKSDATPATPAGTVGVLNRTLPIYKAYKPCYFFLSPHSQNRVSASDNMPLDVSLTYTIRNKKTGTFLDLTGDPRLFGSPTLFPLIRSTMLTRASLATGWGWLGRNSQKVGDEAWVHILIHPVYTVETYQSWRCGG